MDSGREKEGEQAAGHYSSWTTLYPHAQRSPTLPVRRCDVCGPQPVPHAMRLPPRLLLLRCARTQERTPLHYDCLPRPTTHTWDCWCLRVDSTIPLHFLLYPFIFQFTLILISLFDCRFYLHCLTQDGFPTHLYNTPLPGWCVRTRARRWRLVSSRCYLPTPRLPYPPFGWLIRRS